MIRLIYKTIKNIFFSKNKSQKTIEELRDSLYNFLLPDKRVLSVGIGTWQLHDQKLDKLIIYVSSKKGYKFPASWYGYLVQIVKMDRIQK